MFTTIYKVGHIKVFKYGTTSSTEIATFQIPYSSSLILPSCLNFEHASIFTKTDASRVIKLLCLSTL